MKIKQLAIAVVVVVSAPALAQCSADGTSSSADESGVVRYGSVAPSSMDPRKSGPLDAVFLTAVYDSLIDRTPEGKIKPGLATEWTFSADGKTVDLTLREGVVFQDGETFDAAAVEANIMAAKEPGAARATELEAIDRVEVVDDSHVRLHLSRPATQLTGVLAGEGGMMISPKALDDPDLATQPVGAGPYRLTEFSQGQLVYTAWDRYWNKESVKNEKLIFTLNADSNTQFRALQSGQLNLYGVQGDLLDAAKKARFEVTSGPTSSVWQLILNTTNAKLAKPEIRKAIALALDREAISQGFASGRCLPTVQPFGDGILGHVDELEDSTKPDLDEARRLMAEAGVKDGFNIDLLLSNSSLMQNLATVVQADLKKIGIDVKLDVVDQPQSTARQREGQFEMVVSLAPAGRPDPSSYVANFYAKGGTLNPGFTLDSVESMLLEAQATTDEEERQRVLAEITTTVRDEGGPTVPICNSQLYFVHPVSLSGLVAPKLNDYDWTTVVVK